MYIFLSILIVIACLLLIGAVLIQKSKGGGLASDYSSGNQYMGYRKTTDFIEKATWSLAVFICVLSIVAAFAVKQCAAPVHPGKDGIPDLPGFFADDLDLRLAGAEEHDLI